MRTKKLLRQIGNFIRREDGPTTVEYAVMLMMIILGVITALQVIGSSAAHSYNTTADGMNTVLEATQH